MRKPNKISRRRFIGVSAAGTAAGMLAGKAAAAAEPFISVKSQRSGKTDPVQDDAWKICMFSKHLQFLGYKETAAAMKAAGLDGVDLTVRPGGHVLPENVEKDLPAAVDAFREKELEVVMMTTRINDVNNRYTLHILRTAESMGIRYYRMGYFRYIEGLGVEESIERNRKKLQKLAGLNRRYNIHGAYQNHAGRRIGGPVWDVWLLIRGSDPRWVGCQYDIRHAVAEGGHSWPLALKLLKNHIRTIVIKDFKWMETERGWQAVSVPLGEGMVDFDEYFTLLKELGIRAPISLHFEYPLFRGENLSKEEKIDRAVQTIRRDVGTLRSMLRVNGLVS